MPKACSTPSISITRTAASAAVILAMRKLSLKGLPMKPRASARWDTGTGNRCAHPHRAGNDAGLFAEMIQVPVQNPAPVKPFMKSFVNGRFSGRPERAGTMAGLCENPLVERLDGGQDSKIKSRGTAADTLSVAAMRRRTERFAAWMQGMEG